MSEGAPIIRKERVAFVLLALLAMGYVIARAWAVPFVNDEARTFFIFNEVGRFQPWYAEWDAANHLLSTALGQVCYLIFGPSAWSLRLPSVLAFGIYLWYVWRIGALLVHRPVRWLLWAALCLMPMLIEFFSLYRGYGMGIAFLLMAVFHLMRYAATREWLHFLGALVGTLLATYASATLMVLWISVLGLLALLALFRKKDGWRTERSEILREAVALVLLGALPLAYLAAVGMELAKHGALYYGTPHGLVNGSLPSLFRPLLHMDIPVASLWIVLGIGILLVHAFAVAVERRGWSLAPPVVVVGALLSLEVAGRYALNLSSGVLFPVDRAAMHFVLLIVLLFAFTIDRIAVKRPKLQWAMLAVLIFPFTTLRYANLDHAANWPDNPISEEVFTAAESLQHKADRPLAIGTPGQLQHSWALRNMAAGSTLPQLQQVPEGCTGTDLLLLHPADTIHAPEYHHVAGKPTDAVMLYARNTPLPLELLVDTLIPANASVPEAWTLWEPPVGSLHASELLLVLEAVFTSPARPLEALIVWETGPTDKSPSSYTELRLALERSSWQEDTLRVAHWLPLPDQGAEHMAMRVWNIRQQKLSLGYCRLRVYQMVE